MKYLKLMAVSAILAMVACAPKPEAVAEKFMTAILESDVNTAKKYSTEKSHRLLPIMIMLIPKFAEKEGKSLEETKKNLSSMQCDVNEDQAKCGPTENKKDLNLVKQDGEWKVDVKKD